MPGKGYTTVFLIFSTNLAIESEIIVTDKGLLAAIKLSVIILLHILLETDNF